VAIDEVQHAIDGLGLHDVEQRIVEALQNLRQKAEDLLSKVPLPEQLRPQVEQLVGTLRDVDFDELLRPVREVAAQIRIPDDVSDAVHGGLAEAKRVIENLVPQQLIESISGEVGAALDSIRAFDPAGLVPNLASYLDEAASAIEKLDPRQLAEEIRGPYQAVLDLLDRVHPAVLLRPVIDVFDTLVDAIPAPSALPVAQSLGQALDGAGRVAGRALVEPAARLAPEAQPEVGDPSTPRPVEPPSAPADIRPGDAIRLLGYVPGKLREALRGIEASAVGDVVAEIDSCTGALARQLRGVAGALAAVESRVGRALGDLLAPVAAAQARAQLSIQANAAGASLTVRLDAVAAAGPDRIRHDLGAAIGAAGAVLRRTGNTAGGSLMQEIDRAAAVLESSPLASLLSDFDGLLATLDPEPIAADMDLAMAAVTARASTLLRDVAADLQSALLRLRAIVNELNPMALAQRFISVLEVLREEIDVLNPRRLASELAEIHAAIRQAIDAYDPRIIAEDLARISREVAQQIRALNPQQLLGNLDFWQDTVDRVAGLNPATRLAEVGAALLPVGERLAAIQIDGLIEAVNRLAPSLVDEFDALADAIRNEIIALLESLRYATGSASVSVSAEASVG
jgi:hypothetical protein